MKSILILIASLSILVVPAKAQNAQQHYMSIKVYNYASVTSYLNERPTIHGSGLGASIIYDYSLFPKLGLGLTAMLHHQISEVPSGQMQSFNGRTSNNIIIHAGGNLRVFGAILGAYGEFIGPAQIRIQPRLLYGINWAHFAGNYPYYVNQIVIEPLDSDLNGVFHSSLDFGYPLSDRFTISLGFNLNYSDFTFSSLLDAADKQTIDFQNYGVSVAFRVAL